MSKIAHTCNSKVQEAEAGELIIQGNLVFRVGNTIRIGRKKLPVLMGYGISVNQLNLAYKQK